LPPDPLASSGTEDIPFGISIYLEGTISGEDVVPLPMLRSGEARMLLGIDADKARSMRENEAVKSQLDDLRSRYRWWFGRDKALRENWELFLGMVIHDRIIRSPKARQALQRYEPVLQDGRLV